MNSQVLKFRKKPVVIDAVKWTGANLREIITFTSGAPDVSTVVASAKWADYCDLVKSKGLIIKTLEGEHIATVGDWIIKGVKGECYPCKPDIFELTYEVATPAPIPGAGEEVDAHLPDSVFQDEFQAWWEDEGQYVRSGGGTYERTFAFQAWRHLMPRLVSALQASAKVVPDGWQLVPVEPTIEMIAAIGFDGDVELAIGHAAISAQCVETYRNLLAASPATGGGK